jgi:hypothetical protein
MTKYYFYSADIYRSDDSSLAGCYHGTVKTTNDRQPDDVFGKVLQLVQNGIDNSKTLKDSVWFQVKQFYRVE